MPGHNPWDKTAPSRRMARIERLHMGNDYRLVVAVDFEKALVRNLGLDHVAQTPLTTTHKDYDRIDVKEVHHGN